jgi:hypothetical protein
LGYRKHQGQGHGGGDKAQHEKQGKPEPFQGDINIQGKAEEDLPFPDKKDLDREEERRKPGQGKQDAQRAFDDSPGACQNKVEADDPQYYKNIIGDKTGGAEHEGLEEFGQRVEAVEQGIPA